MTPAEFLAAQGIRCPSRPGNHKTLCPRCSATRKNKRDRCLSVTITGAGAVVHCHHCSWSAGTGQTHSSPFAPIRTRSGAREWRDRLRRAAS